LSHAACAQTEARTNSKAALTASYVEEALPIAKIARPALALVPSELGNRLPMNVYARRVTTILSQQRLHRHLRRTSIAFPISSRSATQSLNSSTSLMNVRTKTTVKIELHTNVSLMSQLSSAKNYRAASAPVRAPRPPTVMPPASTTPSRHI